MAKNSAYAVLCVQSWRSLFKIWIGNWYFNSCSAVDENDSRLLWLFFPIIWKRACWADSCMYIPAFVERCFQTYVHMLRLCQLSLNSYVVLQPKFPASQISAFQQDVPAGCIRWRNAACSVYSSLEFSRALISLHNCRLWKPRPWEKHCCLFGSLVLGIWCRKHLPAAGDKISRSSMEVLYELLGVSFWLVRGWGNQREEVQGLCCRIWDAISQLLHVSLRSASPHLIGSLSLLPILQSAFGYR